MKCPNCGAENDADAFFCVACGDPLESQDTDEVIEGQFFDDSDDEPTILSSRDEIFAQMQAMGLDDQSQSTSDQESDEIDSTDESLPLEPEAPSPPSRGSLAGEQSPSDDAGSDQNRGSQGNQGNKNRTLYIVIGSIVVLLLLCCCCSAVIGSVIGSDPEILEEIEDLISLNTFNDSQTLYTIQSML